MEHHFLLGLAIIVGYSLVMFVAAILLQRFLDGRWPPSLWYAGNFGLAVILGFVGFLFIALCIAVGWMAS